MDIANSRQARDSSRTTFMNWQLKKLPSLFFNASFKSFCKASFVIEKVKSNCLQTWFV